MQREIVRLKLQIGQRDQQLMEVTRERNLYKVKYQELKGKLHQFE